MKILTGLGRSGTTFISNIINKCTEKTSKHESISNNLDTNYTFHNKEYIEVNSFCRYLLHLDEIDFTLLLRSPIDISLSISKRYGKEKRSAVIMEMSDWYKYLKKNIGSVDNVFFFENYTQDWKYLLQLLKSVGCEKINEEILKSSISIKVNSSKIKCETLKEAYTEKEIGLIIEMEREYERYKNIYNR